MTEISECMKYLIHEATRTRDSLALQEEIADLEAQNNCLEAENDCNELVIKELSNMIDLVTQRAEKAEARVKELEKVGQRE